MRTLSIDFGTRRVGLAISDAGGTLATPLEVLEISSPVQAIERIIPILKNESVERIVVGLPLNMDDTIGPAARATMKWADDLSAKANLPIVFVDERLSSFAAEQSLIDRKRGGEKITRKQRKQRLDAVAAAGFLQAFLDGKLKQIIYHGVTDYSPRSHGEKE